MEVKFLASCQREVQHYGSKWSGIKKGTHIVLLEVQVHGEIRSLLELCSLVENVLLNKMIESSGELNSEPNGFTVLHSATRSLTAQRMVTKSEMNIQSTNILCAALQTYCRFRVIKLQHAKK